MPLELNLRFPTPGKPGSQTGLFTDRLDQSLTQVLLWMGRRPIRASLRLSN